MRHHEYVALSGTYVHGSSICSVVGKDWISSMISAIGLVAMFKRRGFHYITCMFCEMNYDYDQYLVLHTEFLCVCACKGY